MKSLIYPLALFSVVLLGFAKASLSIDPYPDQSVLFHYYHENPFQPGYKQDIWKYESVSASSCENLARIPSPFNNPFFFGMQNLKIENKNCILLFSKNDCKGPGKPLEAGTETFPPQSFPLSFRDCREDASRAFNVLDTRVKLFKDPDYSVIVQDRILLDGGCLTLPNFFQRDVSSAKIPFCLILYTDKDCSGSLIKLEKGHYPNFKDYYFNDALVSYKPCNPEDIKKEPQLNAKVLLFEVFAVESNPEKETVNVEMAAKTTFSNNGPATLTKRYDVSKTIKETSVIRRSDTVSNMHKVSIGTELTTEMDAGIPLIFEAKIKATLKTGYEYTRTGTSTDETSHTNETSRTFTVSDTIQIPPCTEYSVHSYVKTTRDYPMRYSVTFEVTGNLEEGPAFTADEIIKRLGSDMHYIRTKDDHTVIAKSESTMTVDYAWDSYFNGVGKRIPGCTYAISLSRAGIKSSHSRITFFKNPRYEEELFYIDQGSNFSCNAIPKEMIGSVKSIRAGVCLTLYESDDCNASTKRNSRTGFEYQITPDSRQASYLPRYLRKARSVSQCRDKRSIYSVDHHNQVLDSNRIRD